MSDGITVDGRCELCGYNPCGCIKEIQEELPYIQQQQKQIKEAEKILTAIIKTSQYVQPNYLVSLSREYFKKHNK